MNETSANPMPSHDLPIVLESGERVLWHAAPAPGLVVRAFLFGNPMWTLVALAVTGLALAVTAIYPASPDGLPREMTVLIAIAVVFGVFALPVIRYLRARATTYMVTNRRLVVAERIMGSRIQTYGAECLVPLRVFTSRPDQGDVYFSIKREAIGHPHCGCGAGLCLTPKGEVGRMTESGERSIEAPVGFIGIRDPRTVAALISDQFGIPEASRLN